MDKISHGESGTSFEGPNAVEVFRLATLISSLKLEAKGMKLSRGKSALSVAKATTGLKTRDYSKHIARLEIMIENAKAQCVEVVRERCRYPTGCEMPAVEGDIYCADCRSSVNENPFCSQCGYVHTGACPDRTPPGG